MNGLWPFRQYKRTINIWSILSLFFVTLILIPNVLILVNLFTKTNENWEHIRTYMLQDYIWNTVIIVIFTSLFVIIIGTTLAWFVTYYNFPFKNFFKWALILPLAIPPYIGAYTYYGILNYTGVIQKTLRNHFDIQLSQKYFDIMNIPGAVFIFTLFLFPYVYTIVSAFLERQSAAYIENARLLGSGSGEVFFRIILPISRAAIIAGTSLVIMEVLNDYGVVKYFGIQTFSTAIFQTWFGMADLESSVKLAGLLMIFVVFILLLERVLRGRRQFSSTTTKVRSIQPVELKGTKRWAVLFYVSAVFTVAFIIPFTQLFSWMLLTYEKIFTSEYISYMLNSVTIAFVSAVCIMIIALIVANFARLHAGFFPMLFSKITVLGYSIPGAVIAIGVISMFIMMDQSLQPLYASFQIERTLLLSTSIVMLLFAFIIRFLAIGFNAVDSGFQKVGKTYTEASRLLGRGTVSTFFKTDLPLIKGSVLSGFILVFVDVLKELPLTLFLRPFNFHTLATKAYQYASDEMIHESATASIMIILVGGIAIYIFHSILGKGDT